jgi:hypothetical protein
VPSPGNPFDDAKAESVMKTIKTEEINGKALADISDARRRVKASSQRSITRTGYTRRSDTNHPLSSKPHSRKTEHHKTSWQPLMLRAVARTRNQSTGQIEGYGNDAPERFSKAQWAAQSSRFHFVDLRTK